MVDKFMQNLVEPPCLPETQSRRNAVEDGLFEYRALKCQCRGGEGQKVYGETESELLRRNGYKLSIGETFIQYYYLC